MDNFDLAVLISSLAVFGLYHVYFWSKVCTKTGAHTQLAFNLQNSLIWIDKHRVKDDAPSVTLAIQTLRNTILVAIFVGGSSFQYAFLVMNSVTDISDSKTNARAIILAVLLFLSFLCWTGVIRYANHLGFVIGTMEYKAKKESEERAKVTSDIEAKGTDLIATNLDNDELRDLLEESKFMVHRMLTNFSLGFRFLYMAIPYVFYSSGSIALIVSTVLIFLFLLYLDHPHGFFVGPAKLFNPDQGQAVRAHST